MAELDYPVKRPDSCAPLQISIGQRAAFRYSFREETLLGPALRRYREFAQNSANGFPVHSE